MSHSALFVTSVLSQAFRPEAPDTRRPRARNPCSSSAAAAADADHNVLGLPGGGVVPPVARDSRNKGHRVSWGVSKLKRRFREEPPRHRGAHGRGRRQRAAAQGRRESSSSSSPGGAGGRAGKSGLAAARAPPGSAAAPLGAGSGAAEAGPVRMQLKSKLMVWCIEKARWMKDCCQSRLPPAGQQLGPRGQVFGADRLPRQDPVPPAAADTPSGTRRPLAGAAVAAAAVKMLWPWPEGPFWAKVAREEHIKPPNACSSTFHWAFSSMNESVALPPEGDVEWRKRARTSAPPGPPLPPASRSA
eukprot:CAMPEP_0206395224 /NCGR_PEP_ID=MMETSP0294-20121207/21930_1 /ASSEMBLY_ACC=CAM_ASM_000327 /TAXON_ID=39354 /ORGANISM="Heterosigma akashiwo, Strain CCMP2393" /LENGTH=301 /DNA_ID=CAMNT_0053849459 /DNA_START=721 /DNA_END=1625 /DNA_ORIENTATION=+